jgi:hypothetical protein
MKLSLPLSSLSSTTVEVKIKDSSFHFLSDTMNNSALFSSLSSTVKYRFNGRPREETKVTLNRRRH